MEESTKSDLTQRMFQALEDHNYRARQYLLDQVDIVLHWTRELDVWMWRVEPVSNREFCLDHFDCLKDAMSYCSAHKLLVHCIEDEEQDITIWE